MDIPETEQAKALQRVAGLGKQRADLLKQAKDLLPQIEQASVEAARLGAARSRIGELAQVSPTTLYGWLAAAGIVTRDPKKKAAPQAAPRKRRGKDA